MGKMEGYFSTGQSPQRAVVPVEEEEEEKEEEEEHYSPVHVSSNIMLILRMSNCINTASGIVTLWCGLPVDRLREMLY
jgi:hypothetical protein